MVRISDARMSGTAFGTVVLHVAPEAAAGGPLALVRTGDWVELDVPGRTLTLDVPEDELARRRLAWQPPEPGYSRGYARLYVEHVQQADKGADLDFLVGASGAAGAAGQPLGPNVIRNHQRLPTLITSPLDTGQRWSGSASARTPSSRTAPSEMRRRSALSDSPGRHWRSSSKGRVTDPGGVVTDQQRYLVPGLLRLAPSPQVDCVADMQERGGDVDPVFDPERAPVAKLAAQLGRRDDVGS